MCRLKGEFENALAMLFEHESRAWQSIISQRMDKEVSYSARIKISNLAVNVQGPKIDTSVEAYLHRLDGTTPEEFEYDDLIPRFVEVSADDIALHLKDLKEPVFAVPKSGYKDIKSFTFRGIVTIAEQVSGIESLRVKHLRLEPYFEETFEFVRSVSPVKIYLDAEISVQSKYSTGFIWGPSVEPYMADFVEVVDTFTKPNADPSLPLGWWDKLRLVLHGQMKLRVFGGGDVRVRITGSTSPYFDPKKHFGTHGLEFVLAKGVEAVFGRPEKQGLQTITLRMGQLMLTAPQQIIQGEECLYEPVVNLVGGVETKFLLSFLSESEATVLHSQIVLKDPRFVDGLKVCILWFRVVFIGVGT